MRFLEVSIELCACARPGDRHERRHRRFGALAQPGDRDHRAVIDATRRGLPIDGLHRLIQTGCLTAAELDRVVLPRKTLSHRRKIGSLTPEQSDRLVRVVRGISAAEETFGSQEKPARWS